MKSIAKNLKAYLQEDAISCSFELGWTISRIKILALNYWKQFNDESFSPDPSKFKQQLFHLLASKLNKMPDLTIKDDAFKKLNDEMYKLLICSLASNRTPDEIILGLQTDTEMRNEVIDLVLSRVKLRSSHDDQRAFINKVLLTDNDLRTLLNKQTEKKGFPHNI